MTHEVGDIVQVKTRSMFGPRQIPDGLDVGKKYKITRIIGCIDGAWDWDDLFLEGFGDRMFCEFDFVKNNEIEDER